MPSPPEIEDAVQEIDTLVSAALQYSSIAFIEGFDVADRADESLRSASSSEGDTNKC